MAVDPAGLAKVKLVYVDALGPMYAGLELLVDTGFTTADLQGLCDVIAGSWDTNFASGTNPLLTLEKARIIASNGAADVVVETNVSASGSLGSTTSVPRSACLVTGYGIASYYRGGKPRTYWPYIGRYASGSTTHWQTGIAAQYVTNVEQLMADVNAYTSASINNPLLGCIRRHSGGSPITPTFFEYLSVHGDDRICTQRRRLGRL